MQNTGGPVPLHTRLTFRRTSESGGSSGIRLSPARLLARPSCCAAAVARWSGCTSSSYLCRPHLRPASRTPCRICQPAATVDKQATWAKEGVCGGSGSTNERTNKRTNARTHTNTDIGFCSMQLSFLIWLNFWWESCCFFILKKGLSWLQQTKSAYNSVLMPKMFVYLSEHKNEHMGRQTIWLSVSWHLFLSQENVKHYTLNNYAKNQPPVKFSFRVMGGYSTSLSYNKLNEQKRWENDLYLNLTYNK